MNYAKKLGLNLVILGSEAMIIVSLLAVFLHWWAPETSVISVIFWSVAVGVLLKYGYRIASNRKPTLSMTTLSVIAILLLSVFAGVQPMSLIKDRAFSSISNSFQSSITLPADNKNIVGKWQRVVENKTSILSPTMQFLGNGTIIVDDGHTVVTGTYNKLTDEYVKITVETDFFGVPIKGVETLRYQISNEKLTIRTSGGIVSTYQRME